MNKVLGLALCAWLVLSLACTSLLPTTPRIVLYFEPESGATVTADSLSLAQTVLQKRLEQTLAGQASVAIEGDRLRVSLTNEADQTQAVQLALEVGEVVFFDAELPPEPDAPVPAEAKPILTNEDIAEAQAVQDATSESWLVDVTFTTSGAEKLAQYSAANIGRFLVIARDNRVITAPMIQSAITEGRAVITEDFDQAEAERLAAQLNSGRLPFGLELVETTKPPSSPLAP